MFGGSQQHFQSTHQVENKHGVAVFLCTDIVQQQLLSVSASLLSIAPDAGDCHPKHGAIPSGHQTEEAAYG